MEFNILPKAKILSPHSRNKSNNTTTQTVNVILPNNNKEEISEIIEKSEKSQIINNENDSPIEEIKSRDVNLEDSPEKLSQKDTISTINFLKLLLESYINNPIKYNGYIICSVPVLENLIETLTNCDDCDIQIADIETKCCTISSKNIIPITKIWVKNNDSCELFKYKYSQYLQIFEEYHISLKFAYLEIN